jgi:ankyrin repeat protein
VLANVPSAALPALLAAKNEAGSPAVHWAVLNNHVACVQALVEVPEAHGGGIQVLKVGPWAFCPPLRHR